MTGDAATELLREALAKESARHHCAIGVDERVVLCTCGWRSKSDANLTHPRKLWADHVTDALLPVVEAECRRRAAAELRAAAAGWPKPHAAWLLERADAIEAMAAERPAMRHSDGTICRISLGHAYCAICGRNA